MVTSGKLRIPFILVPADYRINLMKVPKVDLLE